MAAGKFQVSMKDTEKALIGQKAEHFTQEMTRGGQTGSVRVRAVVVFLELPDPERERRKERK